MQLRPRLSQRHFSDRVTSLYVRTDKPRDQSLPGGLSLVLRCIDNPLMFPPANGITFFLPNKIYECKAEYLQAGYGGSTVDRTLSSYLRTLRIKGYVNLEKISDGIVVVEPPPPENARAARGVVRPIVNVNALTELFCHDDLAAKTADLKRARELLLENIAVANDVLPKCTYCGSIACMDSLHCRVCSETEKKCECDVFNVLDESLSDNESLSPVLKRVCSTPKKKRPFIIVKKPVPTTPVPIPQEFVKPPVIHIKATRPLHSRSGKIVVPEPEPEQVIEEERINGITNEDLKQVLYDIGAGRNLMTDDIQPGYRSLYNKGHMCIVMDGDKPFIWRGLNDLVPMVDIKLSFIPQFIEFLNKRLLPNAHQMNKKISVE